ncbi:hypothetical protein OAF31_01250 [Akkermansiaceae bacterium]|nr:hypothetical protein [Akkermansiaceae bacterium]
MSIFFFTEKKRSSSEVEEEIIMFDLSENGRLFENPKGIRESEPYRNPAFLQALVCKRCDKQSSAFQAEGDFQASAIESLVEEDLAC